jgi:outer membrane protein OmpA-like peptidoglycan-associated protein
MSQVFDLAKDPSNEESVISKIGNFLSPGASSSPVMGLGSRFLSTLFGANTNNVVNALSDYSGVKKSTASSIMSIAAPMVLAFLGKWIRRDGLNASGLASRLSEVKNAIKSPLSGEIPGTAAAASSEPRVQAASYESVRAPEREAVPVPERRKSSPWLWLLPLLAILGLWGLYSMFRGARTPNLGDYVSTTLPGSVQLRYPKNGMEAKMVNFIQDVGRPVDKNTWFEFDRLQFETNSTNLKPESREQLRNVVAILTAYPNVNMKIGGYTDNTGDPAANQKLSQDRANNVMKELTGMGIAAGRLSAEGYGEQNPIADNSTEQGRARNRRVAVNITKK